MNKKLKTLLLVTIAAVVLLGYLYSYFYHSLNQNKQETKDLYTEIQDAKEKLRDLQNAELNIKKTISEGEKISALFLNHDSIADFIQIIEGLIKESGISGSVESVSETVGQGSVVQDKERLSIVIITNGKWSGTVNLLGLLERLPYKATLESFNLSYGKLEEKASETKNPSVGASWKSKINLTVWVTKKSDKPEGRGISE